MADEVVKLLGYRVGCLRTTRVEIALKLKGVSYEFIEQDYKSPLILKYNPIHKNAPVLLHNGKPIVDSLVIIEYIDETWTSGTPIMPQDDYGKAMARFWAKFLDDKCLPAIYKISGCPGEEQTKAIAEVVELLKVLENELKEKPFFGGDNIGLVDIAANFLGRWFFKFQDMTGTYVVRSHELPRLNEWRKLRRRAIENLSDVNNGLY